jgi:hypothetical protein
MGAGVGVGVEFGVESVDGGPSIRLSSEPFTLSLRNKSYCLSTILLKVSSSTAGLQCYGKNLFTITNLLYYLTMSLKI